MSSFGCLSADGLVGFENLSACRDFCVAMLDEMSGN